MRVARRLLVLVLLLVLPACGGGADSTPDGAVRELARLLGNESYDPEARRRAFELFDPRSREELTRRARRASESAGRTLEPHDMIVPGGTTFLFEIKKVRVVEERIDRAVVEVRGREGEKTRVRLVREGDAWRVVLPLGKRTRR